MKVYTYSEARQRLAQLLDEATAEGEVRIRRRDGQTYVLCPLESAASPLGVPSLDLGLTAYQVVGYVREGRRESREPGPRSLSASHLALDAMRFDGVAAEDGAEYDAE